MKKKKYPISSIFLFIFTALTINILMIYTNISSSSSINTFKICYKTIVGTSISFAFFQISIINLWIQRLRISFKNTNYALSNCTNYIFRISFCIIWLISTILLIITFKNIHIEQIEDNSNKIITCTATFENIN